MMLNIAPPDRTCRARRQDQRGRSASQAGRNGTRGPRAAGVNVNGSTAIENITTTTTTTMDANTKRCAILNMSVVNDANVIAARADLDDALLTAIDLQCASVSAARWLCAFFDQMRKLIEIVVRFFDVAQQSAENAHGLPFRKATRGSDVVGSYRISSIEMRECTFWNPPAARMSLTRLSTLGVGRYLCVGF